VPARLPAQPHRDQLRVPSAYIFIGMAGTQKAIISWGVGKRNTESTMDFLHDLRSRVIGQPEISTDGFHPYRMAISTGRAPLTVAILLTSQSGGF
jgi:hypothetical protein